MSKFHCIAGAVMMSLGSLAAAQSPTTLTRAELEAVRSAYHDGTLMIGAQGAAGAQGRAFAESGLTRAQVRAELDRARTNGEIEWHSYAKIKAVSGAAGAQGRAFAAPGLTREQVSAELQRARAGGELDRMPFEGSRH